MKAVKKLTSARKVMYTCSMDNVTIEFFLRIIGGIAGLWMSFMWINSQFNDEEDDVTDANSFYEYWIRKIARLFKKK